LNSNCSEVPLSSVLLRRRLLGAAAALLAVERGARIVRVHDVRETVDALKVLHHLQMQDLSAG